MDYKLVYIFNKPHFIFNFYFKMQNKPTLSYSVDFLNEIDFLNAYDPPQFHDQFIEDLINGKFDCHSPNSTEIPEINSKIQTETEALYTPNTYDAVTEMTEYRMEQNINISDEANLALENAEQANECFMLSSKNAQCDITLSMLNENSVQINESQSNEIELSNSRIFENIENIENISHVAQSPAKCLKKRKNNNNREIMEKANAENLKLFPWKAKLNVCDHVEYAKHLEKHKNSNTLRKNILVLDQAMRNNKNVVFSGWNLYIVGTKEHEIIVEKDRLSLIRHRKKKQLINKIEKLKNDISILNRIAVNLNINNYNQL